MGVCSRKNAGSEARDSGTTSPNPEIPEDWLLNDHRQVRAAIHRPAAAVPLSAIGRSSP